MSAPRPGWGGVTGIPGRIAALFLEPAAGRPAAGAGEPPEGTAAPFAPPAALAAGAAPVGSAAAASAVAVVGAAAVALPVAAACAGELRARERAPAALVCIWRDAPRERPEPEVPAARSPAGATTPGARRLAARLSEEGLAATACGRLAWVALDPDAGRAAAEFRRCRALSGAPCVLAVAGPRPEPFEPLLAELDLALAVLPAGTDPALRELAGAAVPGAHRVVLPPLPPGPPRWAAMAGLARLRSLPEQA